MIIRETHIDKWVTTLLRNKEVEESAKHISSGKLSAGMLGQPLQWQILKMKGIKAKGFDDYTLRKFARGNDVEAWLVDKIPALVETQKKLEFMGAVGIADAIVSTNSYDANVGIIPHEIKSVTNRKYAMIVKSKQADRGHIFQACFYALAMKSSHFAIDYVASDDYRILTFVYKTSEHSKEVKQVIKRFDEQLATGLIPVFVAEEKWQENFKYNSYPEWSNLTVEEIKEKYEKFK